MERAGMSFQEKSLWVQLVGLIGAFGFYFATVARTYGVLGLPENVMPAHVGLFVAAVVLLVMSQIAGHTIVAIAHAVAHRRNDIDATDERDRLIDLEASRYAGFVLATGVFLSLCTAIVTQGNFAFTHLLLAFWVLSQLTWTGSQLVRHRRDA